MEARTKNIIIISITVLTLFGLFAYTYIKSKNPKKILLLGGLDNRSGDLDIGEQVSLLKEGVDDTYNIKGLRYKDIVGIIQEIKDSKKELTIVLFSAGCKYSDKIAQEMLNKNYSLKNIYIVEPYATSSTTSNSIQKAVKLGVPNKNVIVGKSKSVGSGVVDGTTSTPSCTPRHWCALKEVGKIIQKK